MISMQNTIFHKKKKKGLEKNIDIPVQPANHNLLKRY